MDEREEHGEEHGHRQPAVHQARERALSPAGDSCGPVRRREGEPEHEVQAIARGVGDHPPPEERRAEKYGDVEPADACPPGDVTAEYDDERPHESAGERAPDRHHAKDARPPTRAP
jgi:hypothetical protein